MDTLSLIRNAMLAAHILAAAVWVGGMFYALVVLRPALNILEAAPRLQLHLQVLKRFFLIVWHAMPIMLLTGWGMVFNVWGGMAFLPWYVNAMQGVATLMTIIFLYTFFVPWQRLRRAIRPTPEMLAKVRGLITLNLVLGGVTIIIGSLGHSW